MKGRQGFDQTGHKVGGGWFTVLPATVPDRNLVDAQLLNRFDLFTDQVFNLLDHQKGGGGLGITVRTFDQALYDLYISGEVTYDEALAHADSPNDLRLMIKLASETDSGHLDKVAKGLSLQKDDDYNEDGYRKKGILSYLYDIY